MVTRKYNRPGRVIQGDHIDLVQVTSGYFFTNSPRMERIVRCACRLRQPLPTCLIKRRFRKPDGMKGLTWLPCHLPSLPSQPGTLVSINVDGCSLFAEQSEAAEGRQS